MKKSKRKIIYISISIGCTMALFLSVMGFLPDIFIERTDIEKTDKETLETAFSKKPSIPGEQEEIEGMEVNQTIEGLYLPTYNKAGKEQMVLRGEHAVFINNRLYKITNPIIDIYYTSEKKSSADPFLVTITSSHGEMDKVTNIGILYDNVVIKLTEKLNAYTDNLKYEPKKGKIRTDETVAIVGEKMKITGKGFVADLSGQRIRIENDVELHMESIFLGQIGTGTEPLPRQSTHITSDGPFIFEKQTNTATFLSRARVTKGTLTLLADNLVLHVNPDNGKLTRLVAKGNVLLSDAPIVAEANILTWDATSQIVVLEGDPLAKLFEKNTSIVSSKIILNQKDNSINVPSEGRLVTELEAGDGHPSPSITNITWKGSMSFSKDKNEALFKKGVEVTKEDSKMTCGILLVNFDPDNSSITTLKASRTVHILETKGKLKREAKASQVILEPGGNLVEMVAEPYAWIKEGNRQITAPYIMFFDNGQKIVCEGQGNLSIKPENKEEDEGAGLEASSGDLLLTEAVNVSWLDRMVFDHAQQKAFFYGGVKTVKDEQMVESDQLAVFLNGNNFDKIVAKGNVYFKDLRKGGVEGVGDVATWECNLNFIVLGGNPKAELRRGKSRSFARLISYDLQSQRIRWEKDTHLQFPFAR
ncbi:MAG: LPS export ABC transporter periplasmic protein LptC [Candidatus Brocadiales bacterium]